MIALIFGTAALCALGYLTLRFTRDVIFAWYCVLGWSFLSMAGANLTSAAIGINLSPGDLINFALLVAGIARFVPRLKQGGNIRYVCIAYVLIFACSVIRGVMEFNPVTVGNLSRSFLTGVLAMLYFTTVPTDEETIRKLCKIYLALAVSFVIVMMLHYAGVPIGGESAADIAAEGGQNRALGAESACVIAISFFISLGWVTHREAPRWIKLLPPLFASSVLVLQHRTVWNVIIVGLLLIPFVDFKMLGRLSVTVLATLLLGAIFALAFFGSTQETSRTFEQSSSDTGTLEWRYGIWTYLIEEQNQSPLWVLIGRPIGTPIVSYQAQFGVYNEAPEHSEYVTQYVSTGGLGVLMMVIFILTPVYRLLLRNQYARLSLFPSTSTWILVSAGILVYGVTYSIDFTAQIWLGVINAMLLGSYTNTAKYAVDGRSPSAPALSSVS